MDGTHPHDSTDDMKSSPQQSVVAQPSNTPNTNQVARREDISFSFDESKNDALEVQEKRQQAFEIPLQAFIRIKDVLKPYTRKFGKECAQLLLDLQNEVKDVSHEGKDEAELRKYSYKQETHVLSKSMFGLDSYTQGVIIVKDGWLRVYKLEESRGSVPRKVVYMCASTVITLVAGDFIYCKYKGESYDDNYREEKSPVAVLYSAAKVVSHGVKQVDWTSSARSFGRGCLHGVLGVAAAMGKAVQETDDH